MQYILHLSSLQSVLLVYIFLTLTGCNANVECVKAVCTKRTFAYACWLLHGFRIKCEDMNFEVGPTFYLILLLLCDFLKHGVSQGKYRIVAELNVMCVEVMTLSRMNKIHTL